MTTLAAAIETAHAADRAYEAALKAHGFKSRWDDDARQKRTPAVLAAYQAKVDADREVSAAFERSRHESKAREAYEADVAAKPLYPDGSPRKAWDQLDDIAQLSWTRNPTPRWTKAA